MPRRTVCLCLLLVLGASPAALGAGQTRVLSWGGTASRGPRLKQAGPPAPAPAPEEKAWSVETAYEGYSIFLFRGVDLLDGTRIHQPHVTFVRGDLAAYYYGFFGGGKSLGLESYEENDYGVEYTLPLPGEKLSLTAGAVVYTYPGEHAAENTTEIYGLASFAAPLEPTFSLWWDLDEYDGGYATLGISRSFDITDRLALAAPRGVTVETTASLGLDFGYNAPDRGAAFNDILLGVKLPLAMDAHVAVHVLAQYSIALDSLHDIDQGNEWVLGFGGIYAF